ncbi:uncharacterized protein LOC116345586 [Contarinia nasturtii]|uniref:uncharacterized protein LOC116345586 n=1 Tax=Contarinia nasturtii TaxID=265458 RepID=UPI0012D3A658|nr:uncharacterized protein LOC116345586 [Contarinia nasturtii]
MIWRDPINHATNCYICLTHVFGFSKRNIQNVHYATVDSVTLPVPHSDEIPIPQSPQQCAQHPDSCPEEDEDEDDEFLYGPSTSSDPLYIPDTTEPHMLSQGDSNDLVRDLNLSKNMSELLGSRLQQWSLLQKDVSIIAVRQRSAHLAECFATEGKITYCKDIPQLFQVMQQEFVADEWRLFIDGAKTSLKAVLLNNGNVKPSIPVAFGIGVKEEYDTMKQILNLIQYTRFNFKIVADLKVIGLLMGLKKAYPKYPCFLCLWDSRAYSQHYTTANWPARTANTNTEEYSIIERQLVPKENIILPPLHIKLGLMTQFIKALGEDHPVMDLLYTMFPRLSTSKIHQGIFVGPQIRKVLHSAEFEETLTLVQLRAWMSFERVVDGFLGNYRDPNYETLIAEMLRNYGDIGAHLSLKMHFLKSHLNFFPDNLGDFSDEHGERFHQDIGDMEDRFNNRYTPNMLGEYCWYILRDTRAIHKRRGPKKHF